VHQPILRKLRAYRTRIVTRIILEGVFWTMAAVVVLVGLSLAIDYTQRLGLPARIFSLVVGLGILSYVLYRQLVSKLTRPMDDERMALTVEDQFPELRDRLISSLQFAAALEAGSTGRSGQSLAMMSAVSADAAGAVEPLDLRRTVDQGRLALALSFAMVLWAGLITFAAFQPAVMRLWFRRNILMAGDTWPRRTRLTVSYDDRPVAEGDTLEITVEADVNGDVPAQVIIEHESLESDRKGEETLAPVGGVGDNEFKTRRRNIVESFRFRASGGDATTRWYDVTVVKRPTITQLKFWAEYPSYTGLAPEWLSVAKTSIRVLPGTRISVALGSSKPLEKDTELERYGAWIEKDDEAEPVRLAYVGPEETGPDGQLVIDTWFTEAEKASSKELWTGVFEARRACVASFHVLDTQGLVNRPPQVRSVDMIKDVPPKVTVAKVGVGDMIRPNTTLPLRIKAADDFGVKQLYLEHRFVIEDKYSEEKPELIPFYKLDPKTGGVGVGYKSHAAYYHHLADQLLKTAGRLRASDKERFEAHGRLLERDWKALRDAAASTERRKYEAAEGLLLTALRGNTDDKDVVGLLATVRKKLNKVVDIKAELAQNKQARPWRWELKNLGLQEGFVFTFRGEAKDYKEPENIGKTESISFRVVSADELMADLVRRQIEQRQDFERVADRQRSEVQIEIDAASEILRKKQALNADQTGELRTMEETVRHSAEEVKLITDKLAQILAEMTNNKVGDTRETTRLREHIIQPLRRMTSESEAPGELGLMPTLSRDIKRATEPGAEDVKNQVTKLSGQNQYILEQMKSILEHMLDLENYRRIVDETRRIKLQQEKILKEIQKELEKLLQGSGAGGLP